MSADIGKYHQFSPNDEDKQQKNSQPKDEVDFIKTPTRVQFNIDSIKHSQQQHQQQQQQRQEQQQQQQQQQIINEKINNKFLFQKDTNFNDSITTNRSGCNNLLTKKFIPGTIYGDCEVKTSIKSSLSTLEKLAIFNIHRKRNTDNNNQSITNQSASSTTTTTERNNSISTNNNSNKEKHKPFVKSASIARLLGNTYNTKKFENDLKNSTTTQNNSNNNNNNSNSSSCNGPVNTLKRLNNTNNNNNNHHQNNGSATERFQKCSNMDNDNTNRTTTINNGCCLQDFHDDIKDDFSSKAFRTISRSLGKLWWKRTHSIEISAPDPEYKVSYLGNVLTGWAKGEGCIEKPLNTLWRNHTQNHKPDVIMRIKVCASGLKATTRQHGLTEYWAHRITYCCAPKNYPKVFCWIYRHEGRKLKHELRCHAVLCSKESIAQDICNTLRENLDRALRDFKREKISKQNARLSLANAVYDNPSLPRRKILLSVGGNNYRPPLERSKSAPKLMAIEEAIGEEDGETEQTNEPEMQSCCAKDSMYPAMTLGRRRCRRGHSIRRTGKGLASSSSSLRSSFKSAKQRNSCTSTLTTNCQHLNECTEEQNTKDTIKEYCNSESKLSDDNHMTNELTTSNYCTKTKSVSSLGSDEDDLDRLLSYHDYDTNSPLAGELLSYFDMKMHNDDPKTSSLTNLNDENVNYDIYESTLTTDPKSRPTALSLDHLDSYSCEESADEDENDNHCHDDHNHHDHDDVGMEKAFYCQSSILKLLQNNRTDAMYNMENDTSSTSSSTVIREEQQQQQQRLQQQQHHIHLDSDEGSISSGCETASTVTANMDDTSLKYNNNNNTTNVNNNNDQNSLKFDLKFVHSSSDQIPNNNNNHHNNNDDQNDHKIMIQHQRHQIINGTYNEEDEKNNNNDNSSINCNRNKKMNFILPNSEQKQQQQEHQQDQNKNDIGKGNDDISDSEFSDESGYVEFQEQNILQNRKNSISL